MFTIKIENSSGDVLTLTHNENYDFLGVTGLNPPAATLNFSEIVGVDGSIFNSSKVKSRNLVFTIRPRDPVEQNRLALYKYFRIKQWCKIYYTNGSLNVQTEGYVETVETDLFSNAETMQISVICPKPYFESLFEIYSDVSRLLSLFEFPFAIEKEGIEFSRIEVDSFTHIENVGDIDTGIIIEITARGTVKNPVIYNTNTGGKFGVNITLNEYDQLIINTNPGEKSVSVVRSGIQSNAINGLQSGIEWFLLDPGENTFSYDAAVGSEVMSVAFRHRTRFGGV